VEAETKIILKLRARDFAGASFMSNQCCAVANAANWHFDTRDAREHLDELFVKNRSFSHPQYGNAEFEYDMAIALRRKFDDTIIRELELTEIT
jgi:hypothetical protein